MVPIRWTFARNSLTRLLTTQQQVREAGPDPDIKLITDDELEEIRRIWRTERQDWEDAVPKIYAKFFGARDWIVDDKISFDEKDKKSWQQFAMKKEFLSLLFQSSLTQNNKWME